jgi:hypothetical protein
LIIGEDIRYRTDHMAGAIYRQHSGGGRAIVTFFAVAQFPKLSVPSEEMLIGQEKP